jgi:hypothetical protein
MAEKRRPFAWRPLVRSLHRDTGYLAIGLTLVYALSGLAVNHIADWDPNFVNRRVVHRLQAPLTGSDAEVAAEVLARLGRRERPQEVYRAGELLYVSLGEGRGALHVNPETGRVVEEAQHPRFFLRLANWLHLNRGKKAWTLVADAYAVGLLCLAISGMFMLPGKNGMRGRGAVLAGIGAAVPILYVVLSGGPQ